RAARQPGDSAAGILIPMRRAKARESGHQVNAPAIRDAGSEGFDFRRIADQLQPVPEPLDDRTANEYAPFERIIPLAIGFPGNGGQKLMLRFYRLGADVHKHEAASAISVFGPPARKTVLPKQSCLLIARDPGDGNG